MKKYILSQKELDEIYQQATRARCPGDERVRLLCIYWAGKSKEVSWIKEVLLLPARSIYHYLEEYASKKKTNNDDTNSSGRPPKLSLEQEGELKEHLEKNI